MIKTVLFVVSLLGMAVSAAVLILLVPGQFRAVEPASTWAVAVAAGLTVLFAAGTALWRPRAPASRP